MTQSVLLFSNDKTFNEIISDSFSGSVIYKLQIIREFMSKKNIMKFNENDIPVLLISKKNNLDDFVTFLSNQSYKGIYIVFGLKKEESNFKKIIGKFKVESTDEFVEVLNPELRIYNQPNIVTSEADIKTSLFADKFITMNIVQNQEYFNIRYQFKPLMIWIWFSVLLISFGGLISLFKKRNEI